MASSTPDDKMSGSSWRAFELSLPVSPHAWGPNLYASLDETLQTLCRSICSSAYGYFLEIRPIQRFHIIDSHPTDFEGHITVRLQFFGRTFMPRPHDCVEGTVYKITAEGVFVSCHMLRIFIPIDTLLSRYELEHDFSTSVLQLRLRPQPGQHISDGGDTRPPLLRSRTMVTVELVSVQHREKGYMAIGRLQPSPAHEDGTRSREKRSKM